MANLPTLYEHYTSGGITQGLSVDQPYFTLNNKNVSLYSGAMHYFRVPQEYWRDRLRKMRAAGLNAVETYVPWNLHEPQPGMYDFGQGGTDMQDFLDIEKFLKTAQEEDLFAIVRPGPFICSEFEFGGLPSYLLREKDIKFRTSDNKYMSHVRRYFNVLLTLLASFQFTKGGPIIAFQIENEYGSTENSTFKPDKVYLEQLRQLFIDNKITELLLTSDSPYDHGSVGSLPSLFQTANFDTNPERQFDKLKTLQKNKPAMAMEYWSGWFNHWSEKKFVGNVADFKNVLERILKYPASVNFYMFHGGTSFGFLNGANIDMGKNQYYYQPDITSYDYDAPLTENGAYTDKYYAVKDLIAKYNSIKTKLPDLPSLIPPVAYPTIQIEKYLPYSEIIKELPHKIQSKELISMENLPINNNTGQSFGYIIYRKSNITIKKNSVLKILDYVCDSVNVYINNKLITKNVADLSSFGYWKIQDSTLDLSSEDGFIDATLDLVVANLGRNNFGYLNQFYQFKGLWKGVLLDEELIKDWEIFPVEFKRSWNEGLSLWGTADAMKPTGAGLYKAKLLLEETSDTFVNMNEWNKGIVIVNNFVLGRYWKIGPQQSLYLPAPLLKVGHNEIIVFEEFSPAKEITFSDTPVYGNNY